MKHFTQFNTFDLTISDLCQQVDYWKEQAAYFEALYEKERLENIKVSNERLEMAKDGVKNALMLALRVRESKNGDLVIPKENRKALAENYKS